MIINIGEIPFEGNIKDECKLFKSEIIERINQLKDRQLTVEFLGLFIKNINIIDSENNRNSIVKLFENPKKYYHIINMFMVYSQIDFLKINIKEYQQVVENKDASKETIMMCQRFIDLINYKLKHKSLFEKIQELCGDNFEWINKEYGMFKIKNCKTGTDFDNQFYKLLNFNTPKICRLERNKIFTVIYYKHDNNFIYCEMNNKNKKRKRDEKN